MNLVKLFHLRGLKRKIVFFRVNHCFSRKKEKHFVKIRRLLNSIGFDIGEGTKILAPFECSANLVIGKNCWIGKNFNVNGNGSVVIGDNCDIGPDVVFQTGGHEIGSSQRRAGNGVSFTQTVGNGTWIGGRVTILNNTHIGDSCVIAGCACVVKDVPDNTLVGGVPAKIIRRL